MIQTEMSRRRRLGFSLAAGAAVALALPPFGIVPLLLVLIPVLLTLLDRANGRLDTFLTGWCFGFGMFVSGLYWIAWALTVELETFWWMIPFAMIGLPAFLALFIGAAAVVWRLLPLHDPLARAVAFAIVFSVAEWLRGILLTGFPWNLMGYGWTVWTPILQSVSVIGIYGLSFLTVLVAALPFALVARLDPVHRRRSGMATAAGVAGFALLALAGWVRVVATDDPGVVPDVTLRLVQPNIAQEDKWDSALRTAIFEHHLSMSQAEADGVTHVIWPETAIPYFLSHDATAREMIADAAPQGGAIITGAPRLHGTWDGPDRHLYNSLMAVSSDGELVGHYDKFHLVPFGEYVPFRSILPIERVTAGRIDFSPGPGPRTLHLPGLPAVGPLICYEVIFPGRVVDTGNRPSWLLNLTNDAWYGPTSGPYQHFEITRVRAVEEGLPMVRVANTGISGVIDPKGHVVDRLGLGQEGVMDVALPAPWPSRTIFSIIGHWGFVSLLISACFGSFLINRRFSAGPNTRYA